MNNFLSIFKINFLKENFKNIFERFIFSSLISFFTTIYFLFIIYFDKQSAIFLKFWFSLIFTFFLSVSFYLIWESKNFSKLKNNIFQIIPFLIWCIFYIYFLNLENISWIFYWFLGIFVSLLFISLAYFLKNILGKNFWKNFEKFYYIYILSILESIFFPIFIWFFIFLLASIWIFAIENLFEYKKETNYFYAFILISCLIWPFIWLFKIPKKQDLEKINYNEKKYFSFIIKQISIPAIIIYFIILYIYWLKVLFNFSNWPKWEIAWLVIWFSVFWYFIYIFSYIYEKNSNFVKFFRKYFPIVVLPQIFMLFYALFLRIWQHNLTIFRYLWVLFWFWLLISTFYFIFSKNKRIIFAIYSLFIISLISFIWPLSIYNFPEKVQTNLILKDLKKANIFKNWKIEKNQKLDEKLVKSISSKIIYLCDYHSCEKLAKSLNLEWVYKTPEEIWEEIWLKIDYNQSQSYVEKVVNISLEEKYEPLEIKWYDFEAELLEENNKQKWTIFDLKSQKIFLYENWKIFEIIDISDIIKKIEKDFWWKDFVNLKKPLIFEIETEKLKTKIIINSIYFNIKNKLVNQMIFLDWKILYSKK